MVEFRKITTSFRFRFTCRYFTFYLSLVDMALHAAMRSAAAAVPAVPVVASVKACLHGFRAHLALTLPSLASLVVARARCIVALLGELVFVRQHGKARAPRVDFEPTPVHTCLS